MKVLEPYTLLAGYQDQPSFKFLRLERALAVSSQPVQGLLHRMAEFLVEDSNLPHTLVCVKVWKRLCAGDLPSQLVWHVDIARNLSDPMPKGRNLLYQIGAGCRTLFRRGGFAPEGFIVGYGREKHTATPATKTGPRLFVRLSQSAIRPRPKNSFEPYRQTLRCS